MLQPEDVLLQLFQEGFRQKIGTFVEQSPEIFSAILSQIYGGKVAAEKIEAMISLALQKNFPLPASLAFVGDETLNGAYGAYHPRAGGTVYLNQNLMKDPETLQLVFFEEVGHHLDEVLTPGQDSPGDEGFMFRLALEKGAPLDEEELELGLALNDLVVIESEGESLTVEVQSFPAPTMKALQLVSQNLARNWFDWRVEPAKVIQAFEALDALESQQRLVALNTFFIQSPKKASRLMDNLLGVLPEALPRFMHWFTGDRSLYGPATLALYEKHQFKFHQALVAGFRKDMCYGKADWQVKEAAICGQIAYLEQLPEDSRNTVLKELFQLYLPELDSFFSNLLKGVPNIQVETCLGWLASLDPASKHAFIGGVQGEIFGLVLQAMNRLTPESRREIILGFGLRNWLAKLYLEKLWALVDGNVGLLPRLESAFEGLMERLDLMADYQTELALYHQLFLDTRQTQAQEIVLSLEDEGYLIHRAEKSKAHFRLRALGVEDTLSVIESLRQAYMS